MLVGLQDSSGTRSAHTLSSRSKVAFFAVAYSVPLKAKRASMQNAESPAIPKWRIAIVRKPRKKLSWAKALPICS